MQFFAELWKSASAWFPLVLGAVLGGISWYVHRRADKDQNPGPPAIDLLQGAIAGAVALGVLRPADLFGQISTALVAGYSASAFLAKQGDALISKAKDDATTNLMQTADAVKQANHTVKRQSLLNTAAASAQADAAVSQMAPAVDDHEINEVVTTYLNKIAQADSAKEVRALQNQATLELKQKMQSVA